MNKEKNLTRITLQFDDGSTRAIEKGFVCSMVPLDNEDGTVEFTFNMCDVSGAELETIIGGVLQLGDRLGMFDGANEEACADEY